MRIDALALPVAGIPSWEKQSRSQTQYAFIRSHIGGWIEPVALQLPDGLAPVFMYVHEEGKLLGLAVNRVANFLVARYAWHLLASGDFIVGSAIVAGSLDAEGNHQRFTTEQRHTISEVIRLRGTTNNQGETT